ncbi:hypothetical protein STEG23_006716, partial [Scotinomys teguina]
MLGEIERMFLIPFPQILMVKSNSQDDNIRRHSHWSCGNKDDASYREAAVVVPALHASSCCLRMTRRRKMPESRPQKTKKDPVNKFSGKAKKKKWSKGKVRDKLNILVSFDKATYDKLCKDVPNYKLRTPAVVSERLK